MNLDFIKKIKHSLKENNIIFGIYNFFIETFGQQRYSEVVRKFIDRNSKLWDNIYSSKEEYVLVDCTTLAPDCFWGAMKKAEAYKEKYGYKIKVILPGINKDSYNNAHVFASYGVDDFVYIGQCFFLRKGFCKTVYFSLRHWWFFRKKSIDDFIAWKFNGIQIGDCIYDAIIRWDNQRVTLHKLRGKDFWAIFTGIKEFFMFKEILSKQAVAAYIVTEYVYYRGIRVRLAVYRDIKTEVISDAQDKGYNTQNLYTSNLKLQDQYSYHDMWKLFNTRSDLRQESKLYFAHRMKGQILGFDAKNAFKDKQILSKKQILDFFGSHENKKNIVVASHLFKDAVHASQQYVFRDYYDWLYFTLQELSRKSNINVFLRLHPSRAGCEEVNIIDDLIREFQNIKVIPDDWSTYGVLNMADVILTARGTIALEAACVGIPSMLVSESYYDGFGVVPIATTKAEYITFLKNIAKLHRCTDADKMAFAKLVLYLSHNFGRETKIKFNQLSILPGDDFGAMVNRQYEYLNEAVLDINNVRDEEYQHWLDTI